MGSTPATRWLFGDQLGPHFADDLGDDGRVLLVEARGVFRRRAFHRQKAHLVLSAMRHRAAELGERATYVRADSYREGLARVAGPLTVCHPTSRAAEALVHGIDRVTVLPARGFTSTREEFAVWARSRGARRLVMGDFYRDARRRLDVLMDGAEPAGGRWSLDTDNRLPPPKGASRLDVPAPWRPREDEIDEEVRHDLDRWERDGDVRFVGRDGPRRFAATHAEAERALRRFVDRRLASFGAFEDAMLDGDPVLAHSLLSASFNLGLLDPMRAVRLAERAYRAGDVPLASAEGFIRQLIGWRDYMWHLYWHFGEGYRRRNALRHHGELPDWFLELDADRVEARCLARVLADVRDRGWTHHIPRLMVLGNYALQRGWQPAAVTDWFHRCFVDGYDWVMLTNVVGMSQYADGGRMTTKPYAAGGAYIDRMSDFCHDCRYRPTVRTGDDACPFTAGYWWFVDRHRGLLAANHRTATQARRLARIEDITQVTAQERARGDAAP